jgi:hypothetical protein
MQHPNIVEIHEFGHRDGLNYFSMRLVEGPSLAQRLAQSGAMPEREAAACVKLLAEAMDYAHRLDVLHLDLKPANVLTGPNGEPLIADFGLARRVDAGGLGGEEIAGTPSYMAPEQALLQSHPLTASTDIYGLGAILYELLTAQPPFAAGNAQATLERVVAEAPRAPRALNPRVSADLEAICLKCLEKDPMARYASARALAEDLQRFLDGHPVSAHPLGRRQRLGRWMRREPRLALAVGCAILALAVGIGATSLQWRRANQALADAEYLSLVTMLPGATNLAINELRHLIHARLDAPARRATARRLAASREPLDWLRSALVGDTLDTARDLEEADAQLRRAVDAMPSSRLALIVAIRDCGSHHRWLADEEEWKIFSACVVPDANRRLVARDPDNLFAWASLLDPPHYDQNQSGHMRWRYQHDPVVRSQLRAVIARAAQSTRWDDGSNAVLQAKAAAYGASYFPMPPGSYRGRWHADTESAESLRGNLASDYSQAWRLDGTYLPTLSRACNPELSDLSDATLHADCVRIFRLMSESKGSLSTNIVGWFALRRLGRGTPLEAEMEARLRQLYWLREQELWARDRNPVASAKLFTRDFIRYGQLEANLRQADRLGIARQPPQGWTQRETHASALSSL